MSPSKLPTFNYLRSTKFLPSPTPSLRSSLSSPRITSSPPSITPCACVYFLPREFLLNIICGVIVQLNQRRILNTYKERDFKKILLNREKSPLSLLSVLIHFILFKHYWDFKNILTVLYVVNNHQAFQFLKQFFT